MAINTYDSDNQRDNEQRSFKPDKNGDAARNVCDVASIDLLTTIVNNGITSTPSGLSTAGLITEVALNSSTWTALPASALTARNGIGVQNDSAIQIKLNFDNTEPGYVGWNVNANGETFIDITDAVILYAKSASGTPTVTVMEVS